MRVLITGGAGFIGSHLAADLDGRTEVRVLDDLSSGRRENLDGLDLDFREGSILDREAVREAVRDVDCVYHLAALVSVVESMRDPRSCVEVNVLGLLNVLEEAAAAGVPRLVFSSSSAVYGEGSGRPAREDDPTDPASPYALSKLDGEFFCRLWTARGGPRAVALRFFNVFGPRQDPASPYAAAIAAFADRAQRDAPLTVYGDGEQTRDFVFVKDVTAALRFVAGRPDAEGVYNVATGRSVTVNEVAEKIRYLAGSAGEIVHAPARAGELRHSSASTERLAALGFHARYGLAEGLRETLAWMADAVR